MTNLPSVPFDAAGEDSQNPVLSPDATLAPVPLGGVAGDPQVPVTTAVLPELDEAELERQAAEFRPIGKRRLILRRFLRNKGSVLGICILLAVLAWSVVVMLTSRYKVDDLDFAATGAGPSAEHWFGTNLAGADVWTLLAHGTWKSMVIGICVGVLTPVLAVAYGCTMAYVGGWVDKVMLFVLETLIMAPSFLLIAIVMAGRSGGWILLVVMLVAFGWMGTARLVRGMALSFVGRDYVRAARYMGIPGWKIIARHLMPNIASLTILNITMGVWGAILSEVVYSYIGIGVKVPDTSLGLMISQASDAAEAYPWLFWSPIVMLTLITGPLALINDGLRDAFDPNSNSNGVA